MLFIEVSPSSIQNKKVELKMTGSLGDVMKESMKIAYIFARNLLKKIGNDYLENTSIHIHVPEGATPKDGPSAGIAVTSGIISLALNRGLSEKVGMTGEISLKGKVMKIGGLKEKVIAAQREGVRKIIVPFDNKDNVEDLPQDIKEGMEFVYAHYYEDVFNEVF